MGKAQKKVKKTNNSAFSATHTYIKLTLVSFFFTFFYAPSPKRSKEGFLEQIRWRLLQLTTQKKDSWSKSDEVFANNHLKEGGRPLGKGLLNCYFCGSFLCRGRGNSQICKSFFVENIGCIRGKIRSVVVGFTLHACCICLFFCVKSVAQQGDSY